jgi:ribosomal protein S30
MGVRGGLNVPLPSVHGSLARAGKVKGQTPKVDKQEKKKTPKGRAKKRILYNRRCVAISTCVGSLVADGLRSRFVNVTTLPGGKRRMYVILFVALLRCSAFFHNRI